MSDWFRFLRADYVQGFPAYCGMEVERVAAGQFDTRFAVKPHHTQQDGFVHAGVMATMADHTAGYAAFTLVDQNHRILTIEFKINYFKPAVGDSVKCRARVIHPGSKILVAESNVYAIAGENEKHVARATVTLMSVPSSDLAR